MVRTKGFLWALALVFAASHAVAEDTLAVVSEESIFAVVTHKGGFASGLAHNHLVAAGESTVRLRGREGEPEEVSFEIELATEGLVVDASDLQQEWYPRLEALGILDEPFAEISEKDRNKIRKSMLGKKQLDAASYPTIRARLVALVAEPGTLDGLAVTHRAALAFEVHGKSVERPLAVSVVWDGASVRVEAAGTFLFSDFEIKPFSAMMGAVKNLDEFHVYVSFLAVAAAEGGGGGLSSSAAVRAQAGRI